MGRAAPLLSSHSCFLNTAICVFYAVSFALCPSLMVNGLGLTVSVIKSFAVDRLESNSISTSPHTLCAFVSWTGNKAGVKLSYNKRTSLVSR